MPRSRTIFLIVMKKMHILLRERYRTGYLSWGIEKRNAGTVEEGRFNENKSKDKNHN